MFTHYYDLKDPKNLPVGASFYDPIDNVQYIVKPKESLSDFINRIEKSRIEKHLPAFYPEELKQLIVISLAEGISENLRAQYFAPKAIMPGMSEIVGLAKALVTQNRNGVEASYLQRQDRASKCTACILHKKKGTISKTTIRVLGKLAGLKDLAQSELETTLGICGMCGCGLQAKIRFGIAGVLAGVAPSQFNKIFQAYGVQAMNKCWILQESLEDGRLKRVLAGKIQNAGQMASSFFTTYLAEKSTKK